MKHSVMIENADTAPLNAGHSGARPPLMFGLTESLVDKEIKSRASRSEILPAQLFADPAWDMLLYLYRAQLRQHRVSVTKLCIASRVPFTTALRWVTKLESEGLVIRSQDWSDARRWNVRLTVDGSEAMTAFFR